MIVHEAGRVGLIINVAKTELMAVGTMAIAVPVLTISDQTSKVVEDFCFLGSWIRSSTCDFVVRHALAGRATMAMLLISANFVSPALDETTVVPSDSRTNVTLRRRGLDDDPCACEVP
jgi:hypothetical protein